MKAGLILVAGGQSIRFRNAMKKQFIELKGIPIFILALKRFADIADIKERILVLPDDDISEVKKKFENELSELGVNKFVKGGKERVYSVINGFEALSSEIDTAIVHDAVRPFIAERIIKAALDKASDSGAAIVATRVKDTLKKTVKDNIIGETVDRSGLFQAQTPQVFSCYLFKRAVENWKRLGEPKVTDDAMLVELLGEKVTIVEGSPLNIKITQSEDIKLAQAMLNFLP